MGVERTIYRIINSARTSVKRDRDNGTVVLDSKSFKGLPVTKLEEITRLLSESEKIATEERLGRKMATMDSIAADADRKVKAASLAFVTNKAANARMVRDNIFNDFSGIGQDSDPMSYNDMTPNVWISPYEANALYSQKGLPEIVINKKSKSILLNGVKIKNKMFNARQIDKISLNMVRRDIPKIISDGVRDALVYGGALTFPMFNKDSPVSTGLNLVALIKTGILRKNSISHIVTLDRWNTMHLPITNPTQKDFLKPEKYYIPFLGADVHGSRCSRVITGQQAGYFGTMMTFGWGLPDFVAYARSYMNYKVAIKTLPIMIQQMSILARQVNIDGILATEGANILEELIDQDTIKYRQMSMTNPIALDILGELKVINRDFAEVPSLLRILRQDFAADTTLPEPMLFSSEKGNFASGDDTQGNMSKQYEVTKYIHKDVESQFKQLAKILIIDTLGVDDEIIRALPYTEIHFDEPIIANSTERAQIGENLSKTFFNLVSGQMPLANAVSIMSEYGGDEMSVSSELLEELQKRQDESDEKARVKFEKEIELLEAQIEQTKNSGGSEGGSSLPSSVGKGEGYSRLDQKQHEKTKMPGEKKFERIQRAQGK